MNSKRLLILGGGFLQAYVIKKAKELGYWVMVLDADPHAIGFRYADESAVIDIVDEEACLKYAREKQIDGVLTAATDFSILAVSRIATELALHGINYDSARIIKNKAAVRRCLYESQPNDSNFTFEITSIEQIPQVLKSIRFPVMVKPVDGSGSRATSKVENGDGFEKACKNAIRWSLSHRVIVEPFFQGREYGVESFVDNGTIHVLGIMQKEMTKPPFYAELGHGMPSGLSNEMECKVKTCVCEALQSLNVNHGSVNMDVIISEEGEVHIIDVGARMGGNLIGSHIIPRGSGIAYMENMIRAALGDPTDFSPQCAPQPIATKLLALTPGRIKVLPDIDRIASENGVEIEHHLQVGKIINEYHTNHDGCGYVIASGIDVNDAISKAARVKDIIDKQIVREA